MKKWSLSLLLSLCSLSVSAEDSNWTCDLEAHLEGRPRAFLWHNKDAWQGEGRLFCESREEGEYSQKIQMNYEAWAPGTGVASEAYLHFSSSGVETRSPESFLRNSVTIAVTLGPSEGDTPVSAVLAVEGSHPYVIRVRSEKTSKSLVNSLDLGTLTIRPVDM